MSETLIRLRPNGPLVVEGEFRLVDQNGNPFPINKDKPVTALCRCGQSQRRPFCDGTHKTVGFVCEALAPAPPQS